MVLGAIEFIILDHRYVDSILEAARISVEAGVNLELHAGQFALGVFDWLQQAVEEKLLTEVCI